MNRRDFFKNTGLGTLSAAALANVPIGANAITLAPAGPTVRTLAGEVTNHDQKLAKGLSDDVFNRLVAAFRTEWPHRSMRVVDVERLGERVEEGAVLTHQWNSSFKMNSGFMSDRPPYFNLEEFRYHTNGWIGGTHICPAFHRGWWETPDQPMPVPIKGMFESMRVVGIPMVPYGLQWRALYIDEDTGLVMRALAWLDITADEYLVRWDVLCG